MAVIEAYRQSRPAAADPAASGQGSVSEARRVLRPMLGTELIHGLTTGARAWPVEVLYQAGASAVMGPRVLIDLAVLDLVDGIDWDARAQG